MALQKSSSFDMSFWTFLIDKKGVFITILPIRYFTPHIKII